MHYVYLLQSKKDKTFYTGCTTDLKKRLILHNAGKVESTRNKKPYMLIYYEAFVNEKDAYQREKWLKTGWGRNQIKTMLKNYLKV